MYDRRYADSGFLKGRKDHQRMLEGKLGICLVDRVNFIQRKALLAAIELTAQRAMLKYKEMMHPVLWSIELRSHLVTRFNRRVRTVY